MNKEAQRVAIAKLCGWEGCSDAKCDYRKAQHLHKGGITAFPESYSIPRYPDYLNCLNAMAAAERHLDDEQYLDFMRYLTEPYDTARWLTMRQALEAPASRRAEALLRALGLWKAGT